MSAKSKAEHNTAQAARRVYAELKALRAENKQLRALLATLCGADLPNHDQAGLVYSLADDSRARPWLLGQQTSKGFRYFTGRMHPICPDSWSADIRKAMRFSAECIASMQAHVNAYTWGAPIQKVKP